MVTRKKVYVKPNKINFNGRSYKNYIKEDFQKSLLAVDWADYYGIQDPNLLWSLMERVIRSSIDEICPLKSYKVSETREPWVTNEAMEAIKAKDRMLKKAKRTGLVRDWEETKRLWNEVGGNLRNLRANFLTQQQEAFKSDPKKFWKSVSSIVPDKKVKSAEVWLKDQTTGREVNSKGVAEHFNSFFSYVGPNLAKNYSEKWYYYGERMDVGMQQMETDEEEVFNLCKGINIYKSSGIDGLSSRICKDAFLALSHQLTYLLNCSLSMAVFPEAWKIATVVPLFKGGSKGDVNNYRPVSLLPLPGKLIEKVAHKKNSGFLEANNLLCEHQGGFRKGFSTVATMADLTDDIFNAINQGETTLAAFIDLRKAFDTVDLEIPKNKLEELGIRGNSLRWCSSYLSNRVQCTVANNYVSSLLPISCGVPQGSVLSQLFFLIYINDMINILDECKVKLYADDTVIYHSDVNHDLASLRLKHILTKFYKWCVENKLTLNAKNTKLMIFGTRSRVKNAKNVKIYINNEII